MSHASRDENDNDHDAHDGRASFAPRSVVEHLDYRLVRRCIEHLLDIANAEHVGDSNENQHGGVRDDGPNDNFRESSGSIIDFLGHVDGAVVAL